MNSVLIIIGSSPRELVENEIRKKSIKGKAFLLSGEKRSRIQKTRFVKEA